FVMCSLPGQLPSEKAKQESCLAGRAVFTASMTDPRQKTDETLSMRPKFVQENGPGGVPRAELPPTEWRIGSDRLRAAELGIGLHAEFGPVETERFLLGIRPQPDGRFKREPDDGTGDRHEQPDRHDADQLRHQGAAAEDADAERSPD